MWSTMKFLLSALFPCTLSQGLLTVKLIFDLHLLIFTLKHQNSARAKKIDDNNNTGPKIYNHAAEWRLVKRRRFRQDKLLELRP